MKVIIVGATGTIGSAVVNELSKRHDVIKVGKSSGEIQVDITNSEDLQAFFQKLGSFDVLVSTAGDVKFAPFEAGCCSLSNRITKQAHGTSQSRINRPSVYFSW